MEWVTSICLVLILDSKLLFDFICAVTDFQFCCCSFSGGSADVEMAENKENSTVVEKKTSQFNRQNGNLFRHV